MECAVEMGMAFSGANDLPLTSGLDGRVMLSHMLRLDLQLSGAAEADTSG